MTQRPYQWDPSRPRIQVASAELTHVLHTNPRPATVNEYSEVLGIDVDQVMLGMGSALDVGWLTLDLVGGQLFVNTAPQGRPGTYGTPDCPPNTWEMLRVRSSEKLSWALWKLARSLERSGWGVHVDPAVIAASCHGVPNAPYLSVTVGATVVPTLVFPGADKLQSGDLLDPYEVANCGSVAVVCDQGHLETVVTAVRAWMLNGRHHEMTVLVLEAPRYQPVIVNPADGSAQAVSFPTQG